jgi:hypothetical protein
MVMNLELYNLGFFFFSFLKSTKSVLYFLQADSYAR